MEKSKLEIALDKYFDKFKKNYPLVITSTLTDEEHIAIIETCIDANEPAPEPEYKEGDY